ncbi:hypothetical protein OAU96_02455 [Planctomycetota bacterium]|nr:hypothetical protein [Planctomycetota bacterium]
MARDNVTFRFNIDLTQMTVKGQQAVKILQDLERTSGKAAAGMDRLGTSSSRAGQQSAASAVNFQTATQGMLNLSTAAVQTYTSISNLDRANNRAKMSTIAVARAEDLLANKIERQNTLRAAGQAGSQKDINITREIATAKADLTVKIEKEGIEQAAVNDIYMLFATNIANVTISSMQTLAILDKNQILLSKGKVIAQKLLTYATWENVRAQRASMISMTGLGIGLGASKVGFSLSTVAVRLHTMALHGLKIALGPIGLIFIGISAAMVAYETNLGGIKDTINGLLGVEDDHLKLMDQEREAALELTAANEGLASSYKKLSTPMENYLKLQEVAAAQSGDLAAQIRITQQRLGFSSPSVGGGLPTSAGGIAQQGSGPSYSGGSVSSTLPAAIAPSGERTSKKGQSNVNPSVSTGVPTSSTGAADQPFIADPFGSFQEKANFGALNVRDQALELIKLTDQALTNGDEFKAQSYGKWLGAISDDATNFTKAKEDKHITFADIQKESSGLKSIREVSDDPFSPENLIARSSPFIAKGVGKFKLGTDYSKIGTRTFYAGVGGEMIARIGERYGAGRDSNLVAELSRLQAEELDFTQVPDNMDFKQFSQSALGSPMAQRAAGMAYLNMERNVSSGAGYSQEAIAAGASATARYQGGSVNWAGKSAWKAKLARGDSFVNGVGGRMLNAINIIKGGRMITSSGHRSKMTIAGVDVIVEAVRMGIKGMPEWMDMINQIPDVDIQSEDNMRQAQAALGAVSGIAGQYVSMVNSAKSAIGFTSTTLGKAHAAGFSGTGLYSNISLLAATRRTNFSNTEIIEESKNKLSLTNSQTFAIRFNSTRGDTELQDRFRYVDQLEAMSSGTSPL